MTSIITSFLLLLGHVVLRTTIIATTTPVWGVFAWTPVLPLQHVRQQQHVTTTSRSSRSSSCCTMMLLPTQQQQRRRGPRLQQSQSLLPLQGRMFYKKNKNNENNALFVSTSSPTTNSDDGGGKRGTGSRVPSSNSNIRNTLFQFIVSFQSLPMIRVIQKILHGIGQWLIQSSWFQFFVVLLIYGFHLMVFTQHQYVFPFQLLPTIHTHHFVGIGYDSIVGILTLLVYSMIQKYQTISSSKTIPNDFTSTAMNTNSSIATAILPRLLSTPNRFPWRLPLAGTIPLAAKTNRNSNKNKENQAPKTTSIPATDHEQLLIWNRATFLITTITLTIAYFGTGRFSIFWEDTLYAASALGWPLTQPRFRALNVLLGHLTWVTIGTLLLTTIPAAPRFFTNIHSRETNNKENDNKEDNQSLLSSEIQQHYRWFRFHWKGHYWVWWTIGGYLVSGLLFNMADLANHYILPYRMLEEGGSESVVDLLVAPEHNDITASLLGCIAPCITAPVWEEVLYRGFLLPGLTAWTGSYKFAAVLQAIIFSAHHMSAKTALPLFVLGWTWAVLYSLSGNLWTVCLVHALWNSRVFLSGWLGL